MRAVFLSLALACVGCSDGLAQPERPAESALSVRFEPDSGRDAVASVLHMHLSGPVDLATLALFEGSLTSYALGRIKAEELPTTLSERQVPTIAFRELEEVVVAPARALAPGVRYSLASSQGLLSEFVVDPLSPEGRFVRAWPPPDGGGHFVYCAQSAGAGPPDSLELELEPGDVSVALTQGVDASGALSERCFSFELADELEPSAALVPPVALGDWQLDPLPLVAPSAQPASPLVCETAERALGFGCALADDDRLLIRTPDAPLLWRLTTRTGTLVQVSTAGAPIVVRGLTPSSLESVEGTAYDALGNARPFTVAVETRAAHSHLVLSEVLANPLGPEPASEWVEIVNDGSSPIALAGFELHDAKSAIALPDVELGVGEYALLVRQDFAPGAADVAPAPGTRLIRLPELGSGGLSNSGEVVYLAIAGGAAISAFPPLAPRAGESAARRYPWSPDGAASSFFMGEPTPGLPNTAP